MNLISLFSGIGGFEIAGEWMGWETIASVEINPFGQKTLKYYWPNAYHHENVKTVNYEEIKKRINRSKSTILVAGFPCQPFSTAGKRKGTEDDRYGWPDCITAVQSIQPEWCIFENVSGLISWNGGMVFDEVQADLEAAGYEVIPFVLPACGVNAPHRRDRVWFVAHSINGGHNAGRGTGTETNGIQGISREEMESWKFNGTITPKTTPNSHNQRSATGLGQVQETNGEISQRNDHAESCNAGAGDVSHSQRTGLEGRIGSSGAEGFKQGCETDDATNTGGIESQGGMYSDGTGEAERYFGSCNPRINRGTTWDNFPTQPPVRGIHDGISGLLVRNIKPEIYATISERYTDKDLQEVWKSFQSPEIREQIGRLYKIRQSDLLLEVLQLCSPANNIEKGLSVWSEKTSEGILRKLQEYGTLNNTPHGRELGKQFTREFADTLHILSHEIALVTMETERAAQKFAIWHRQESIKGYGNAIVPQVVFQIFKAIEQYEKLNLK